MKKEIYILGIILLIAAILRFYNLMHDSPYFFNPDERNMANAISQFSLPNNLTDIPKCIISQFSINNPQLTTHNSQLNCNLNPHFFSYGQFPLYLAFTSDQISKSLISPISQIHQPASTRGAESTRGRLTTSFPTAIFWLRFWSALSSTLTIILVYLITNKLFSSKFNNWYLFDNWKLEIGNYAALFAAFSPGLIQSAHFGTTESLLTFFFFLTIYISISYLSNLGNLSHLKFIILTSLTIGLALGSKLTGIFFFVPPFIVLAIRITKLLNVGKKGLFIGLFENLRIGLFLILGSILIFTLSSPYNLVEPESFRSAVFGYESDVATGKYEAFYTRQFVNTTPIIFQALKIFPFVLGWPVFILGSLGILFLIVKLFTNLIKIMLVRITNYELRITKIKKNSNIRDSCFVILASFFIYLLPNSFLFAKWTRFTTPILPFFAIFAGYLLFQISTLPVIPHLMRDPVKWIPGPFEVPQGKQARNDKIINLGYLPRRQAGWIIGLLVFIGSITPGLAFMSIYTHEDTRVTASKWIYQNIPNNSYILSETANVVDIPLGLPQPTTHNPQLTTISFDFYHTDENPTILFAQLLSHLEKADYIFIPSRRIFANYTKLPLKYPLVTKYYQLLFSGRLGFEKVKEFSLLSDENAEETFTVFDHPVIRIYKRNKSLKIEDYQRLFAS